MIDARYRSESGVGRYVTGLTGALAERDGTRYAFVTHRGAPALSPALSVATRPFTVADQVSLATALARSRTRLFHCPHFLVPLLWPGRLVVTVHDVIPLEYPDSLGSRAARAAYPRLLRLACARANALLVPSEATRDALVARGLAPAHRIHVTPYAAPHLPTPVATPVGAPYLLFVGDLKPHKNVARLIDAYAGLPDRIRARARLVVAGDGPERGRLIERSRALGIAERIVFAGRVDDPRLAVLYAGAAALVMPSLAEGFGLPALEAMERGLPVVASDIPVFREVLDDAAMLVDTRETATLTAALGRVLEDDDLRARLAARGRARAERFSWGRTADLTASAYGAALAS